MKGEYDVFLFCERCGEQWFQGHKCGYRMVYEKIKEDDGESDNSEGAKLVTPLVADASISFAPEQVRSDIGSSGETMIVCYIAGPFTATESCTVDQNIDNARRVASEIRSNGMAAIVPHLESLGCADVLDYRRWIDHGIALMRKCDCVVLLEGWDMSKGTKEELGDARWNNQPIFFSWDRGYIEDIKQWWDKNKWNK